MIETNKKMRISFLLLLVISSLFNLAHGAPMGTNDGNYDPVNDGDGNIGFDPNFQLRKFFNGQYKDKRSVTDPDDGSFVNPDGDQPSVVPPMMSSEEEEDPKTTTTIAIQTQKM